MTRYVPSHIFIAPSFFKAICYSSDEGTLLTGGQDGKVAFWDVGSGLLTRELDVSHVGAINGIDSSADGRFCQLVKIYDYKTGAVVFIGTGHMTAITNFQFTRAKSEARQLHLVSVDDDGAILSWSLPGHWTWGGAHREDV
ncbi:hypothetical protein BDK51DRAFT_29558 [Blyttiomyces helicus]|uniref:WD40-repeat-containing domain protein n=1 Tax=Blyttiomyces helicus TaxID=388810 RepID=A0A4P9WP27_9FUNG|nr:hypothetical protein BDK51DRAFT_29558 [Blyttiomyces helicus]|eukprot:RKO92536.1 hypothetical protein BDK51DRAFT_29558 [Blyttiomyces helicus]